MERTLNLNDGWEDIVNDPDRQDRIDRFHAKRLAAKLDKLVSNALIQAIIAAAFAVLTFTNAFPAWFGTPFAAVFMALASFTTTSFTQGSLVTFLTSSPLHLARVQPLQITKGLR